MRTLLLLGAVLLAGCGSGVSISDLACQNPCQSKEDPFKLHLQAVYEDPQGLLADGKLQVRVDQTKLPDIDVGPLVSKSATSGTMKFDVELPLPKLVDGSTLTVGVKVLDAEQVETNELQLGFRMTL